MSLSRRSNNSSAKYPQISSPISPMSPMSPPMATAIDNEHFMNSGPGNSGPGNSENINFFFRGTPNAASKSSSDSSSVHDITKDGFNFIVLQNDEFHRKNESLMIDLMETKNELELIEEDNGRLESSKTILKGIAMNEGEKNRMLKKAITIYSDELKNNVKVRKELENFVKSSFLLILFSQFLLFNVFSDYSLVLLPFYLTFTLRFILFFYKFFVIYKNLEAFSTITIDFSNKFLRIPIPKIRREYTRNYMELHKILKDVTEAEKGNSYLDSLIDSS